MFISDLAACVLLSTEVISPLTVHVQKVGYTKNDGMLDMDMI